MYFNVLKNKIFEQSEVYVKVKHGEVASVSWKEFQDSEWGTRDANYLNRNRLAHYLLFAKIDDEDTIEFLFKEELKDRQTNSFQGIGKTLMVLTI